MAAPVSLGFDITKDKEQFHLVGAVKTTLELSCSRCLETFTCPVDAAFDLRYQPRTENAGEGEREIEEDDLSTAFYENEEIDLGAVDAGAVLPVGADEAALPGRLPRAVPGCGTNLNRGTCDCKREWEDPRLAALKEFRTKH